MDTHACTHYVKYACNYYVFRGYEGTARKEKSDKDANSESASQKGKKESVTKKGSLMLVGARPELVFHAGR